VRLVKAFSCPPSAATRRENSPVSFEPFAAAITESQEIEALLRQSMDFIRHSLL
jgi:2-keto-myo-inositol isomerase